MRLRAWIVLTLALPAALPAQSPATRAPGDGVMLAFENFAGIYGSRLVAALDSIPEARYAYRPTPAQQTVGYIAQHLEDANYELCQQFGGVKHPGTAKDSAPDTVKARWPKDTLVARLRASLRFCDTALGRVGPLRSMARASSLLAFETDLAEHYSQLAGYMRLLGLVPPSALPQPARTAIELPASALRPFVGTYEAAPGVRMDITLHDGALFIHSTVSDATRRLWPESNRDFFLKEVDAQIRFTREVGGAVTGLVVHQNGRDVPAKRIP